MIPNRLNVLIKNEKVDDKVVIRKEKWCQAATPQKEK